MISIHIRNVSKHFGSTAALHNITLKISPGEIFFLLGPSGCGKTTLLRTLAGFVSPDHGDIYFDEKNVTNIPPYRRKVGMVFQNYALWPHLSVSKNISFGLEQLGIPRLHRQKRTHEMLHLMGLESFAQRSIGELSGGQQQRVALARALAVEPHCLLLDEPLSNLDTALRGQMRDELRSLCRKQRVTAIHVTHDQKEALSTADRIAVMENGSIRQVGSPKEIYRQPVDSFVAGFIGEVNLLPGRIAHYSAEYASIETALGLLYSGIPPHPFVAGEPCIVCLRPEVLEIKPGKMGDKNSFPAQIQTSVFLGGSIEYHAQTQAGPLKILRSPLDGMQSANEVSLTISPQNVILLKK